MRSSSSRGTRTYLVPVTAALLAAVAMSGCASASRHAAEPAQPSAPESTSSTTVTAPVAPRGQWPTRHKGGVTLSTGVYTRDDDDLVLNTTVPVVLRRSYNSGDGHQRRFGRDWTHMGEWWLYGNGDPRVPWADLILSTGGRIHFVRISPGDDWQSAVLRHDSTPTQFNGALLRWNGSLWEMSFRDGAIATFLDCQDKGQVCSLVERRDREGHRIAYVRDGSGTLLRMESEGQNVAFDYDEHKRIIRACDTLKREVRYAYDDRGRLVRATGPDGTIRDYGYDEHDKLVSVREPGRILRNWFDESGHWIRQVVKRSEQDDDPYVATARYVVQNGAIVESDFDEGDGLRVTKYNEQHYTVSETFGAEGPTPVVFTYTLDGSNQRTGVTMSCLGPSGPLTRAIPLDEWRNSAAKESLAETYCLRH